MPLRKGKSRAIISANIRKMEREGYPHDRAVAAALRTAGVPRKRNPSGGFWTNPLVWIGGGALAAFVGYRMWQSKSAAPAPPTASVTVTLPSGTTLPAAPAGSPAASMTPQQIQAALTPYAGNAFEFASHYQQLYTPA